MKNSKDIKQTSKEKAKNQRSQHELNLIQLLIQKNEIRKRLKCYGKRNILLNIFLNVINSNKYKSQTFESEVNIKKELHVQNLKNKQGKQAIISVQINI